MRTLSDFDRDLAMLDRELQELETTGAPVRTDPERATKLAYRTYQRASLAGDFAGLKQAETALAGALTHARSKSDLHFIKANLDFSFHRLAAVRDDIEMDPGLRDSLQGRALLADLDFQEGRYDGARNGYRRLIEENRTWDNLARLAYLEGKMGRIDVADRYYVEAEDELTAKEMRSYAWLELQRGVLRLRRGRFEDAHEHYRRADQAYSGYWLVDDHLAEWLGARGEFKQAIALYAKVVSRVPRPELQQALGELCVLDGNAEQGEFWNSRALTAYLESAKRGEVHYYHHLADFYADVREDGAEAARWARLDLEMRDNFSTRAALAWALYRAGEYREAVERIDEALSSGVEDAHLFFQAGTIYNSAARNSDGDRYLERAAGINPHYRGFHVHR